MRKEEVLDTREDESFAIKAINPSPPLGGLKVQNSVQIKCERKHTVMCYQWFLHVEIIKCVYFDLVCLDLISVECFKNQAVVYSPYTPPQPNTLNSILLQFDLVLRVKVLSCGLQSNSCLCSAALWIFYK